MMGSRSAATAAAIVLALACMTRAAHAAPTAAERETARQLMEDARDKVERSDLKGALESFKAADDIMQVPTTGFEVGRIQVALGRLIEGRETLARVRRIPKAPNEPAPFERAREAAGALYDDLAPRIPSLRLEVRNAKDEVAITVDDVPVAAAVAKVPFKVNPGRHVVVAKSGAATARQEVEVAERETKDVVLQLGSAETAATPAPAPPPDGKEGRAMSPLVYVGFGVAGVGVIAGSVTGLMMFSKKSALEEGCTQDKLCPPETKSDYDAAYTAATISTVSFIVAGLGAGVGLYGLLSSKPASSGSAARVEPWAGLGSGGVRGTF